MPVVSEALLLSLLWGTVDAVVQRDGADMTARQTAVLLAVYLQDEPQTVRGLAAALRVSKPAVTRAIDRLAALELVVRRDDPRDGRSILLQRTAAGMGYMRELGGIMTDVVRSLSPGSAGRLAA